MNAFELQKRIGFGTLEIVYPDGDFVTTGSFPTFTFTATGGTTLTVDWGDGTSTENFAMVGGGVAVDRDYSTSQARAIIFTGTALTAVSSIVATSDSLVSVDTGKFTGLTSLSCSLNDISVIDVSLNTALVSLVLPINNLSSVDISSNTALVTVSFVSNNLSSLDISSNTLITTLSVDFNNLPSSEINAHLAQLVANGLSNGNYAGDNQTPPAPPTGQGITDAATLVTRGWTVTTD